MSTNYVEVMPAYGRDYKSAAAAKADWNNGLDFMESTTRRYCSKRDFQNQPDTQIIIRYGQLRKLTNA